MGLTAPRAAYIHIPFCVSKCHYCDFSSFPGMEAIFDDYVRALVTEIKRTDLATRHPLDSVYVGGGTPTVLDVGQLAAILEAVSESIGLAEDCEITLEANPGTVDESKLAQLWSAKFNRLSLGVQSLDDQFLSRIGRVHSAQQAIDAYQAGRRAGFANMGIDLIFALPGQTLTHWENTLGTAVGLGPEHISLYELSIEEGTRFARLCAEGTLDLPDEDTQLDMYELAISTLTSEGYEHYEVSNFARPGFRSRHNQVYWRNEPYYGFGAGATRYVAGERARRVSDPRAYIEAIESGSSAVEFSEHLTGRAALAETVIQGLRMLDGISVYRNDGETCTDMAVEFRDEINRLAAKGLIEVANGRLRVTHQGLLLLNDVAQEFLPD